MTLASALIDALYEDDDWAAFEAACDDQAEEVKSFEQYEPDPPLNEKFSRYCEIHTSCDREITVWTMADRSHVVRVGNFVDELDEQSRDGIGYKWLSTEMMPRAVCDDISAETGNKIIWMDSGYYPHNHTPNCTIR